jgi:homoisocitrate dehydrogenase
MLRHLGYTDGANKLENAVDAVIRDGKHLTPDMGGTSRTYEVTQAVINNI